MTAHRPLIFAPHACTTTLGSDGYDNPLTDAAGTRGRPGLVRSGWCRARGTLHGRSDAPHEPTLRCGTGHDPQSRRRRRIWFRRPTSRPTRSSTSTSPAPTSRPGSTGSSPTPTSPATARRSARPSAPPATPSKTGSWPTPPPTRRSASNPRKSRRSRRCPPLSCATPSIRSQRNTGWLSSWLTLRV